MQRDLSPEKVNTFTKDGVIVVREAVTAEWVEGMIAVSF